MEMAWATVMEHGRARWFDGERSVCCAILFLPRVLPFVSMNGCSRPW